VGLKKQKEIWRLNEISGSSKLAVGDPKFFEDIALLQNPPAKPTDESSPPQARDERPQLDMVQVMTFLGYAENAYAQMHPDAGFTCNLVDLVGTPSEPSAVGRTLDPAIASGSYNGYLFSISGCGLRPSEIFRIVAEPDHTGPATTAFCINATHVVRSADDGRGSTCLASGVVAHRTQGRID
jgi:hypothetical protein